MHHGEPGCCLKKQGRVSISAGHGEGEGTEEQKWSTPQLSNTAIDDVASGKSLALSRPWLPFL